MSLATTITLNDGNKIPVIGLGTWKSRPGEVQAAVEAAISCGYRHIDGAYVYGNEEEVGAGIRNKIKDGTISRKDIFVTTKLWNFWHSPGDVEKGLRVSLKKLDLDYVDLFLMHWPFAFKFQGEDKLMPTDESGKLLGEDVDYIDTYKAMEDLVKKGLTKSIGVSNFNQEQMARVVTAATIKPVNNQVEACPFLSNDKLLTFCKQHDVVVTAYSPLGSNDNPFCQRNPEDFVLNNPIVKRIADKYKKSAAQVVLRWGFQRGTVIIPKSVTPSRIQENFQIFDFLLTEDEMAAISGLNKNFRACGFSTASHLRYFPFDAE